MIELSKADMLLKQTYLNVVKDSLYNELPKIKKQQGHIVPVRTEPKIGRNEQCPCGSGKKYKYCCLNKE